MSVHKPYTDRVFNGTKMMEFRKRIGKDVHCGDTIYVYETKKNSGSGSVIGSVKIKSILLIPKIKVGTYFLLPYYVEQYGTEEEKETVKRAMRIKFDGYNSSLVLSYLFQADALSYIEKNNVPPSPWPLYGSSLKEYNEAKRKEGDLCARCDEWGKKIGFYNQYDESDWKIAILLENPVLFKTPKKIEEFRGRNGNRLTRAPQSWCYLQTDGGINESAD